MTLSLKALYPFAILAFSFFQSCSNDVQNTQQTTTLSVENLLPIQFSRNTSVFKKGDSISIVIKQFAETSIDSVTIQFDNNVSISFLKNTFPQLESSTLKLGSHIVTASAYCKGKKYSGQLSFTLKSDITPELKSYRIKHTYPHDKDAYTQGLECVDENSMYEGTGLNGKSTLRKVDFKTGKVIKKIDIDDTHFGEGIAVVGDKIYQLTWQSHIGFIYDKNTFAKTGEFKFATEGWGLCFDGTNLLMSDGSHYIYTMNPDGFTELSRIAVFDDFGPVQYLNELEYIDGYIYANVYQTDYIVKIDPKSGAVLEKIDFSNLLQPQDIDQQTDVLNGIAYDSKNKRFFVTGKNWPKLFEVEIY